MIKPRFGSQSISVEYVSDKEDLASVYHSVLEKYKKSNIGARSEDQLLLIQQKVLGVEYGLDIINDLNGSHVNTIVKEKHSMRSGETDVATVRDDERLYELGEKIAKNLKHISIVDADVFVSGDIVYALELNPRFGGGYPFSHIAGANLPKAIISWLQGLPVEKSVLSARVNSTFAKHSALVEVGL